MSLTVNGQSLDAIFNVTSRNVYNAPAKDITAVEVPGRSGDILIPNNRYKNKIVSYSGFIRNTGYVGTEWDKLASAARKLKNIVVGPQNSGYLTIEDSYDRGFTRYGYLYGEPSITPVLNEPYGATVELKFMCKPFLVDESNSGTITSFPKYFNNNTYYSALPYMEITWSGTTAWIKFDNEPDAETITNTWTFTESSGGTHVYCCDSEAMEWYSGNTLKTANVTAANPDPVFPILGAVLPGQPYGQSYITASSNVSQIFMRPRWRKL